MNTLSVIIPVYNDEKYLGKCLDSIFNSDYAKFEVIVVNDNSTDNSLDIAKRFPCQIVDLKTNKGVANARNKGAEAAKGDILVFFDSDVVVERHTLSKFAKAHENPDIKIYQCQIHYESLTAGFTPAVHAILHNYLLSLMVPDTSYIQTFAFSINKKVFFEIGGFNTNFESAGGEEFEIGQVIQQHNYKMLLDQSFHIHHNFASFYERFKKLIIRSYIYATIVLQRNFKLDKGYGTVREGVNSLLSVIGALSLIISIVTHYAFLLFLTSIVTQLLVDARLYTYINNKKGIIFSIRAIPVIYAWYLAMGIGATMAVLTYYGQKIFAYLKMFNFLFSKTPPYLIFLVTSRCDARCKHCFNWERVQNPRLSKELTFDEIEKISVNFGSIKYMTYGGGEPSLREDIADITQLFYNNNNLERLNFITNGFATNALVDEVKRILRLCPGLRLTVSFSIDGIESQHDEIRGMPGGFKRLLRTINEIKRLQRYYPKLKILATTVYSNFNMDNIFEVINYITKTLKLEMVLSYIRGEPLDKNAKKVELETYVKATEMVMRLNAENSKKTDIIRAIDNLCFKLIAETKKRGKRILQCVAGKRLIEITSDGTILPCEMIGIDFGNIRDYNYDIKKALKTDRFSDFFKFLKRKDCYCIWECAMKNNIVYSVSQYPSLFFEWFGQRAR